MQYWLSYASNLIILLFIAGIPVYAACRKVDVFGEFVDGAKDGITVAVKIVPYLVAFLVALGMFRAAGGFALLGKLFGPLLHAVGFPRELLPLAMIRPFTGSGSNAVLTDVAKTYGGGSHLAHTAAIMMGSTETTFYVVMVYFGAVGIKKTRHAIPAGLVADLVGIIAAIFFAHLLLQ
jgi:spore maturation protein B